jgi:hypothetical protein
VQIVEIAHDIDPQERAAQARRNRLRSFFAQALHQLRAGRAARSLTGNQLVELLDHPEDAVLVLEEDPAALAEAVAGLCLLVRQEEARSGTTLFPKLRAILLMLSPPSHVRMVVGLPPLLAGFRSALVWAFTELFDEDVTRIALPAVRNMASEIDIVFYGLATAIAHDGRRLSIARRISLRLHDLPHADATDNELVTTLARAPDDHDSFRREREAMLPEAKRALASRGLAGIGAVTTTAEPVLPAVGSRRIVTEIVRLSKGTARFDRLCARLPDISATLTGAGSTDTLLGVLHGLEALKDPTAAATIARLVTPTFAARVLDDLEKAAAEGQAAPEALTTVKILVTADASAVWDRLERTQNIMMQRTMLDALSAAGSSLLPLLRSKLRSPHWMVVRNAVALLPRLGGTSKDLALVARHPNEKVRSEIMHALRTMTPDEAGMDVLVWYLSDASREVQNSARAMLRGEVLGTTAISTLERLAADTSQQEPLRRRYVEVLGRCPHDAAAQSLLRLIQPRGLLELGAIRELAAVALRSSPAPSAAALFQEGLSSPVRRVRKACERAAGGT